MTDRDAVFVLVAHDGHRLVTDRYTRPGRTRRGWVERSKMSHEIYRRRCAALRACRELRVDNDGSLCIDFDPS